MTGQRFRRVAGLALAAATMLVAACSKGASEKPLSIAVIPKGTTHEFWNAIHAGAVKAERELNASGVKVAITWKGPLREDDRVSAVALVVESSADVADEAESVAEAAAEGAKPASD